MQGINLRIEIQKVKLQNQAQNKKLKILVQIDGKNVYTSYSQKVKNNSVNFYGQSFDILLSTQDNFQFKLIEVTQDLQQRTLVIFNSKISQFQQTNKQYNTSQQNSLVFYWTSRIIDQSQTDDEDLQCTNLSMSKQVKHKIFSEQMMDRKLKRLYTCLPPTLSFIENDDKSISSEFTCIENE